MRYVIAVLTLAALCSCHQSHGMPEIVISPEAALDDAVRAELHLPAKDVLILATEEDIQFVKTMSPEVTAAVEQAVTPQTAKFQINAARPVGDYLLLWVSFPDVMDGGADLIYSVEKQRLVGTFLGGYRR